METLLGKKIQAKVIDENDQFYFAQAEGTVGGRWLRFAKT